ncbi:MAG: RsmE family RNA methyltransferase [Verrucomicrobia bacterium]|nr:RsmE family RNA methyltransferase [Verrucomicrobiota bacterium]
MNLILFEPAELTVPLAHIDPRAEHILKTLRRRIGDTFDVGLVDGPIGKGTLDAISATTLTLTFTWGPPPAPADPITLLLGLPRPQTARDILRDATTLGVGALHFVATERSDPNYAAATLWTSGEWRRHCLAGAAQAFATRLPAVTSNHTLATALAALPAATTQRLALDNYEANYPLSECHIIGDTSVVLALGPERGWGPADRAALRAHGFTLVHLGTRVLRSETAVIAALTLVRARLGLL